jgi:hypothetical protein
VTLDELRAELLRLKAPTFAYSIGNDENEAYCLVFEADGWHVYYSERGRRSSEQTFASESDACRELIRRVMNDGAVREWMEAH